MSTRNIESLQQELQKLSEEGTTVEFTTEETEILDINNAYDELPESEVEHG
jgi:hypothetical protein